MLKKRNHYCLLWMLAISIFSCSKEAAKPIAVADQWNKVAAIDEIENGNFVSTATGSSNLYLVGHGLNGYYLISIDQKNEIVEKRPLGFAEDLYLTKDFIALVHNDGGLSTQIKFYSTVLNATDTIATIDSRDLRSFVNNSQSPLSSVQITSSSLIDGSYGVILEYEYESPQTNQVDVSTIRVSNSSVTVANKHGMGIFEEASAPYGSNDWMVADGDHFLVKFPGSLYQYIPQGSVSLLSEIPPGYGLSSRDFIRNDTLFLAPKANTTGDLYFVTPMSNQWSVVKNPQKYSFPFLAGIFFAGWGTNTLQLYKIGVNSTMVAAQTLNLNGIDTSQGLGQVTYFNNRVYSTIGNVIYSSSVH